MLSMTNEGAISRTRKIIIHDGGWAIDQVAYRSSRALYVPSSKTVENASFDGAGRAQVRAENSVEGDTKHDPKHPALCKFWKETG